MPTKTAGLDLARLKPRSPFEYEIIRYVEYIGTISNISKSHVDLVGMSDIRNSLPEKSVFADEKGTRLKLAKDLITTIADRSGVRTQEIRPALNSLAM